MSEKKSIDQTVLPIREQQEHEIIKQRGSSKGLKFLLIALIISLYSGFKFKDIFTLGNISSTTESPDECPTIEKIIAAEDGLADPGQYFFTNEYKNFSIQAWGGAIQFPTVAYDDLKPVGEDDRWLIFGKFQDFLRKTFPLTFDKFDVEYINTYGLLMTLPGTNTALKPALLMAHQDVVPVPEQTVSDWTHPPFSGYFDGEFIWGRGSSDDKNSLIGILEATESLLKQSYSPERTIILSFGFDEEASGYRGAQNIAKRLEEKLGQDSIYMLIDEGGSGIQHSYGNWFGLAGTGEKGYLDLRITLTTTGGHSSIPPDHTGIGIISRIIAEIESHPYSSDITKANPFYYNLQCLAKDGKDMDNQLKYDIQNLDQSPASKERVIKYFENDYMLKYIMRTSQAVDVIKGGIKINALPEQVSFDINHRVAIESSLDFVKVKLTNIILKIAKEFDFGVSAFDDTIFGDRSTSKGFIEIKSLSELNPAPVTPILNNPSWNLLGGTIRQVFEDVQPGKVDGPITIAPSIMTANTDTRHYWNLTKNVYRFTPMISPFDFNIHTVDEHTSLEGHLKAVSFYYNFLRNLNFH